MRLNDCYAVTAGFASEYKKSTATLSPNHSRIMSFIPEARTGKRGGTRAGDVGERD